MIDFKQQSTTRLSEWFDFRQRLEYSDTPLEDTAKYFQQFPRYKFCVDPYDNAQWPTAWELIDENEYCDFTILLGICYTIQLTERYKDCQPKIRIAIDIDSKNLYYLLQIENSVYGWSDGEWSTVKQLPKTLKTQKIYTMKPLH